MAKYTKTKKAKKTETKTNNRVVTFNSNGKAMVTARSFAIASETSAKTATLTKSLALMWAAIHAGDMSVETDHTRRFLEDVRRGIVVKRRRDIGANAEMPAEIHAVRIGDKNAQLHLHAFQCRDNLLKTLNTFDGLTDAAMTRIARWMRGAYGKGGNWSADISKAPSREQLAKLIRERSKNPGKKSKRGKRNSAGPVGMPINDAVRGLGHAVSCLAAFDKKHGKMLGTGERKVIAQALTGLRGLFTPLRVAMAAQAKADAKAAADKAKAKKAK